MTQTLLAWTNIAKLAKIVASSSEKLMPPENTINDIGDASVGWQTLYGTVSADLTYTLDAAGSTVRTIGLFRTNLSATAQITATITYNGVETWTDTLAGPAAGYGQVVFVLEAPEYADSVTIEIVDTNNPDLFINVPLVFIGDAWLPTYSVSSSLADGWEPNQNIQKTRGGQEYVTQLSNPRSVEFEFGAVLSDEAYAAAKEIERLSGLGINVLFIPDSEWSDIKYDAVFGRISNARRMGVLPGPGRVRVWGATITERL